VLELKKNEIVDAVRFTGASLCLEIGQAEETDKISFNGFIALKDMKGSGTNLGPSTSGQPTRAAKRKD
jgi:hypothetical protein